MGEPRWNDATFPVMEVGKLLGPVEKVLCKMHGILIPVDSFQHFGLHISIYCATTYHSRDGSRELRNSNIQLSIRCKRLIKLIITSHHVSSYVTRCRMVEAIVRDR